MDNKILKQVKYLKIYTGLLTLAFVALLIVAFTNPGNGKKKFKEITAQRINIVSPKGKLRMVISNSKMQSPGRINGKKVKPRKRPPGMIFFNEEGDEVGGLIYHGHEGSNKGLAFSVDQYNNDQIMQLRYLESKNGKREYGLQFWDRDDNLPILRKINIMDSLQALDYSRKKINKTLRKMNDGKPVAAQRMFVGENRNHQVGLFIKDKEGRKRVEIYVNKQNKVRMKFLDEDGNVVPIDSIL